MISIYSFWADLISKKSLFKQTLVLSDFPFGEGSDLIKDDVVSVKDSNDYQITPFFSKPPVGKIDVQGEEIDKYYIVRGREAGIQKICLIQGGFFETIPADELVGEVISQILDGSNEEFTDDEKKVIKRILPTQKIFSRALGVENSSVDLNCQVEFEVKPDANILSPKHYPEILDDTLNLVCPFHSEDEKEELISNVATVIGTDQLGKLNIFPIKHPLNGWFLVFQTNL